MTRDDQYCLSKVVSSHDLSRKPFLLLTSISIYQRPAPIQPQYLHLFLLDGPLHILKLAMSKFGISLC